MAIILKLTEEQAEVLGFALTKAMRQQLDAGNARQDEGKVNAAADCFERAEAIREIRELLDNAPNA